MSNSLKEAFLKSPGPVKFKGYIILYLKGFCMGSADLIPGVSGGTIAFITGIYDRFINAISSINSTALKLIFNGKIKEAISGMHLRFLCCLFAGIFSAVVLLARLMHFLLEHHPKPTWGLFFGLIVASIIVIGRELKEPFAVKTIAVLIASTLFSYWIVSLIPVDTPNDWWFIFFCGFIAISAMILPGLSGSFILLILKKYKYITACIKDPLNSESIQTIIIFGLGCICGILSFSRLLKYFLKHHRDLTMAALTGLMIGAMKKLWPWREVIASYTEGKKTVNDEVMVLPEVFNGETILVIGTMIIGFIIVFALNHFSEHKEKNDLQKERH